MLNKLLEWVFKIVISVIFVSILFLSYSFLKFLYSLISKKILFIFSVLVVVGFFHYFFMYKKNKDRRKNNLEEDSYKSDLIEYGYILHGGLLSKEEENAMVDGWEKEAANAEDKILQEAITEYREIKKLQEEAEEEEEEYIDIDEEMLLEMKDEWEDEEEYIDEKISLTPKGKRWLSKMKKETPEK